MDGLCIDLMGVLRDGSSFHDLWERRTTLEIDGQTVDLLALEDLVRAKQTQRDKDWPMVARLMERRYLALEDSAPEREIAFVLRELRTPELLLEAVTRYPGPAAVVAGKRPAVRAAMEGRTEDIRTAMKEEEDTARSSDRLYWEPPKRELEEFRRQVRAARPAQPG